MDDETKRDAVFAAAAHARSIEGCTCDPVVTMRIENGVPVPTAVKHDEGCPAAAEQPEDG